jgi:hypothetical protein
VSSRFGEGFRQPSNREDIVYLSRGQLGLVVGIYRPDTGLDVATVTDVEQLGCDLAILRIDLDQSQMVDRFHRFGWSAAQLMYLLQYGPLAMLTEYNIWKTVT